MVNNSVVSEPVFFFRVRPYYGNLRANALFSLNASKVATNCQIFATICQIHSFLPVRFALAFLCLIDDKTLKR